jgi:Flp pilus assembly protein TadD
MFASRSLLLALPLGLLACGGGTDAPSYGSPAEAAEAAAQALAAGKGAEAATAFEAAAATTDPKAKSDALNGLFRAQLEAGNSAGATAALGRLVAECRDLVTPQALNDLATAALNRKDLTVADAVVNKALELFPAQKVQFAKAIAAVDLLKTKGPGADLSSLGYTGD